MGDITNILSFQVIFLIALICTGSTADLINQTEPVLMDHMITSFVNSEDPSLTEGQQTFFSNSDN